MVILSRTAQVATSRVPQTGGIHYSLARIVQLLGPGYMKFAQIASTRDDLLPPALCEALRPLQDRAKPMSRKEFEKALARSVSGGRSAFRFVETKAIGAGSIACVYRAERWDGRIVAIKLARPAITRRVKRDVRVIRTMTQIFSLIPALKGIPISDMVDAVGRAVIAQVDFEAERKSLVILAEQITYLDKVVVPVPHDDLCSSTAIVMDFIPDLTSSGWRAPSNPNRDPETALQVMTLVFDMLFTTGVVHCDLHPGNLVTRNAGGMAVLDAGFVHVLPNEVRVALARFFLNLGFRNGPGCSDAVLSTCSVIDMASDLSGFRDAMDTLVDRYGGRPADEFDFLDFAGRLFAAQRNFGVYASSDFIFPLLALLMVDGTVRRLDPDIDFQTIARPIVFRAVNQAEKEATI